MILSLFGKKIDIRKKDVLAAALAAAHALLFPLFCLALLAAALLRKRPAANPVRRAIVFNLGGIGDHVFSLPLLAEVKREYPKARIDLLTTTRGVAEWNKSISRTYYLKNGFNVVRLLRYGHLPLFSVFVMDPWLCFRLLSRHYDLALILGPGKLNADYAAKLFYLAGARKRYGSFFCDKAVWRYLSCPSAPEAPLNLRILYVRVLPHKQTTAIIDERWKALALVEPAPSVDMQSVRGLKVVIHPGGKAGVNLRQWDPLKYAEVAGRLVFEKSAAVFLTGGPDEAALCEQIRAAAPESITNLAGKLTLPQLMGVLSQADLVIANDTGPLHLAGLAKANRIVAVYGPTNPDLLAPLWNCHIVRPSVECAPCLGAIGGDPKDFCKHSVLFECILSIQVDQVWAAVEHALEELSDKTRKMYVGKD
ncbi:MAG TPA: glycosyltransferase family 9 protein [Verrucomicrobiae bacterium]|jgi:ADP-heptose:LPS heptosyltransferase|nr:glycosyltransferase family 9 protein [Verrucomicrobiae bacterium]